MSRTPAYLAALASSAVPGLDPASVQAVQLSPGARFEVAFVTDRQQRRWTVRVPTTPAAGAQQDATVALLHLLARRLPFQVPAPKGFVAVPQGRAMVYPHLVGHALDLDHVPAGPGLAAEIGRAIAALHNVDRGVYEQSGVPAYDAEQCRARHLADLDRGAGTGHVPAALLTRWESALEDVTLWRFAPTPTHGALDGRAILAAFDGDQNASAGHVKALLGWEEAAVADPATDIAAFAAVADERLIETILEAYANSRIERPDAHLRRRAVLLGELRVLRGLLAAVTAGASAGALEQAVRLRDLDEATRGSEDLAPPEPAAAPAPNVIVLPRELEPRPDTGDPGDDDEYEPTQEIPEHQLAKARGELLASGDDESKPATTTAPPKSQSDTGPDQAG
ncbi:MAG: phosphotransferase [Dermatophilaceae bacterium]